MKSREELLKMPDLDGKDAAPQGTIDLPIMSTEAKSGPSGSPTALELDEWALRRGREVLADSPSSLASRQQQGSPGMVSRPLRFATFLAPSMFPAYAFIARHVQARLGIPTELVVGSSYEQLSQQADVIFLCGLAYIELRRLGERIEPVAAPLLRGSRYGGRAIYFSDVIVHRDSPFRSFADLRGCSWAFNEPYSHSGPGITCYRLVELGQTQDYFGRVIQAGWHQESIRLVQLGEVDASAVDSHVLALARREHPELTADLRVIDCLGPSTIQPVVVTWRAKGLKADLRSILLELNTDPVAGTMLADRLVERFVAIDDEDYDDLRRMRAACIAAGLTTLRPTVVAY